MWRIAKPANFISILAIFNKYPRKKTERTQRAPLQQNTDQMKDGRPPGIRNRLIINYDILSTDERLLMDLWYKGNNDRISLPWIHTTTLHRTRSNKNIYPFGNIIILYIVFRIRRTHPSSYFTCKGLMPDLILVFRQQNLYLF